MQVAAFVPIAAGSPNAATAAAPAAAAAGGAKAAARVAAEARVGGGGCLFGRRRRRRRRRRPCRRCGGVQRRRGRSDGEGPRFDPRGKGGESGLEERDTRAVRYDGVVRVAAPPLRLKYGYRAAQRLNCLARCSI